MLKELDFPSSIAGEWEDEPDDPVDLDDMDCTESALGKVSLPPKHALSQARWCICSLMVDPKRACHGRIHNPGHLR